MRKYNEIVVRFMRELHGRLVDESVDAIDVECLSPDLLNKEATKGGDCANMMYDILSDIIESELGVRVDKSDGEETDEPKIDRPDLTSLLGAAADSRMLVVDAEDPGYALVDW